MISPPFCYRSYLQVQPVAMLTCIPQEHGQTLCEAQRAMCINKASCVLTGTPMITHCTHSQIAQTAQSCFSHLVMRTRACWWSHSDTDTCMHTHKLVDDRTCGLSKDQTPIPVPHSYWPQTFCPTPIAKLGIYNIIA